MKYNLKYFSAAIAAAICSLTAGSAAAEDSKYPEMTLRLAHFFSAAAVQSKIDDWWANEIHKRSGGKIKVEIFWAESLGKAGEILDLVGSGAVELGATAPGYFPSQLPLSGAMNALPLVFKSNKQAQIITTKLGDLEEIKEEYKKNRVWPLFYHSINNFHVLCTRPVKTLKDFEGLKIRSYGEYVPRLWQALGATPVNALTPELYEGLQRGRLDCAYFPNELNAGLKLYEVAKYQSSADFGAIPTWPIYVNYDLFWNKWTPEVRELIMQVSKDASERDIEMVAEAGRTAIAGAQEKQGVQLLPFEEQAELEARAPNFLDLWLEVEGGRGKQEAAQTIVTEWRRLLDEVAP